MGRFWIKLFPFIFWPCVMLFGWLIYKSVVLGDHIPLADIVRLFGLLIAMYIAKKNALRRYDEHMQNQQALRDWAEEDERTARNSDA